MKSEEDNGYGEWSYTIMINTTAARILWTLTMEIDDNLLHSYLHILTGAEEREANKIVYERSDQSSLSRELPWYQTILPLLGSQFLFQKTFYFQTCPVQVMDDRHKQRFVLYCKLPSCYTCTAFTNTKHRQQSVYCVSLNQIVIFLSHC